MKPKSKLLCSLLKAAAICAASSALAQQITGTSGSPTATTTLSGKQLPPLDPKFGGEIKQKAADSKPSFILTQRIIA